MTDDLDKLEQVARAAQERSPGPWRRWKHGEGEVADTDKRIDEIVDATPRPDWHDQSCIDESEWRGKVVLETDGGYYEPKGVTAQHIATFSPDVVLRLIARVRDANRFVYLVIWEDPCTYDGNWVSCWSDRLQALDERDRLEQRETRGRSWFVRSIEVK
jgi:hypothetical protein